MFQMADQAQKMCEEEGFPKLEFIINEWHYICKAVTAFAAKSADGKKGKLLVTDLFGRDSAIFVQVKGVASAKNVQAVVLCFEKNLEPVSVSVKNGTFTLRKPDAYSSAFLISCDL